MDGHIIRFKLKDFMTYSLVESFPHKHLNIISGGNGTGKSSVFNGILFSLNGKTTFINRAKKIGDFIKHGKEKASLEIELYNSKGSNYIINRTIFPDSTSTWTFNGARSTQREIQAIVDKLNIQVDNLCQFLPQDRVADFAKMNSCELLENTEKAVGDTQLYEKHQQLKSLYTEINEVKKMAKNTEQLLETERAQNQRLEQEVQNFKSKRKFIQQIENMKKKISWLVYSKRKQDLDTKKASLKTQLKKLEESKRSFNEKEKNYSEAETCIKKYSQLFEQKVDAIDNLLDSRLMPTLLQCRSLYSNQISQAKDDYELKLDSIQIGNNQIVRLTSDISELEKQSANESSKFEKVQPELKRSLGEKREHHQKLSQNKSLEEKIKNDFENLNAEKQKILRDIEFQRSRFDYKLENIKHKSQDAYKAYQWLTSNQHLFKHKIIGPISLYMKFKSLEGSQYMENQIGF
ncbi:unnamed protein product [Gordionus sp. m RMFG-2023]